MKYYINLNLDVQEINKISTGFLKKNKEEKNFIRLGVLNNKKSLEQLIYLLTDDSTLVCYDYASLLLTLKEFKELYQILKMYKKKLIFLKEPPYFLEVALNIQQMDKKIVSEWTKKGKKRDGEGSGRPSISLELQIEIKDLYKKEYQPKEIASLCGVSVGTVYKYIK